MMGLLTLSGGEPGCAKTYQDEGGCGKISPYGAALAQPDQRKSAEEGEGRWIGHAAQDERCASIWWDPSGNGYDAHARHQGSGTNQ